MNVEHLFVDFFSGHSSSEQRKIDNNWSFRTNGRAVFAKHDLLKGQASLNPKVNGRSCLPCLIDSYLFDYYSTINVVDIAQFIAKHTNNFLESVTEVSNTGLYTMEEMKQVRLKWQGIDFTTPEPDYSTDPSKTELSPQRIRSFVIKFNKRTEQNLVSF